MVPLRVRADTPTRDFLKRGGASAERPVSYDKKPNAWLSCSSQLQRGRGGAALRLEVPGDELVVLERERLLIL